MLSSDPGGRLSAPIRDADDKSPLGARPTPLESLSIKEGIEDEVVA